MGLSYLANRPIIQSGACTLAARTCSGATDWFLASASGQPEPCALSSPGSLLYQHEHQHPLILMSSYPGNPTRLVVQTLTPSTRPECTPVRASSPREMASSPREMGSPHWSIGYPTLTPTNHLSTHLSFHRRTNYLMIAHFLCNWHICVAPCGPTTTTGSHHAYEPLYISPTSAPPSSPLSYAYTQRLPFSFPDNTQTLLTRNRYGEDDQV